MTIDKVLKKYRENQGLKAKDVASHIGVAESTYRDWENGRKIQGEPYVKIAKALNIPLRELLGLNYPSHTLLHHELEIIEKAVKNIRLYENQII